MFVTEDGQSTPHSGQVFHALVHILATLKDPKYENFQPVIDAYINDHFAAALVYKVKVEFLKNYFYYFYLILGPSVVCSPLCGYGAKHGETRSNQKMLSVSLSCVQVKFYFF